MSDEAAPINLTRASVVGKVPGRGKSHGPPPKAKHLAPHQKHHVKKLKKSGLISERAAHRHGL